MDFNVPIIQSIHNLHRNVNQQVMEIMRKKQISNKEVHTV